MISRAESARRGGSVLAVVACAGLLWSGCGDGEGDAARFAADAPVRLRPLPDNIRRAKRPRLQPIDSGGVIPVARTLHVDDDGDEQPGYDPSAPPGTAFHPFNTIQQAADVSEPGDTVLIHAGTYDSGTSTRATPVIKIRTSGTATRSITFRAATRQRVVLHGREDHTDILVDVRAQHIVLEGLELTGARRAAIVVAGPESRHVTVRLCHAHHNDTDTNWIGAAFRTTGPAQDILFEECISHNNSGGFQLRESPNQTAGSASVPPKDGNTGYNADLPESAWDAWPGWDDIAPQRVTIRRCIAFDNLLIDEHSDGIALRYGIECVFEDNIAFRNADDGIDMLGATRCIARGNIAFNNDPFNTPNGDGNGIKIGVRGGLDNVAHHNIVFENPRGGIDMADTERPVVVNNTVFDNDAWFGIWSEGGRSDRGVIIANNIAADNPKGDIGINGGVAVDLADHNLVSDNNSHNWAVDKGPGGLVGADPLFLNPNLDIETTFPAGLTIPERINFIRSQVLAKLTPAPGSPVIDGGRIVDDVTEGYAGESPDIGAIEN